MPAKGVTIILPTECCAGVKQDEGCAKEGCRGTAITDALRNSFEEVL